MRRLHLAKEQNDAKPVSVGANSRIVRRDNIVFFFFILQQVSVGANSRIVRRTSIQVLLYDT